MSSRPSECPRRGRLAACLVALGLALASCEGLREELGVNKYAPDEFTVVTRAPLILPPDFTLRPPAPGAIRPQETPPRERARAALYGRASAPRAQSSGERALLTHVGAADTQSNIRQLLNEDNARYAANESFIDSLLAWRKKEPPAEVVDAAKEDQRLQEASALGKPPTAGETAIIKRRQKGLLEGIF